MNATDTSSVVFTPHCNWRPRAVDSSSPPPFSRFQAVRYANCPLGARLVEGMALEPGQRLQIRHHFTVDVEEYFQVSALERYVSRESWDRRESRVEASVDRLLGLLERHGATTTFFVHPWEMDPDQPRRPSRW